MHLVIPRMGHIIKAHQNFVLKCHKVEDDNKFLFLFNKAIAHDLQMLDSSYLGFISFSNMK